jgi:cytochrome c oxidase assembly protein subunit 11
MSVRRNNRIVAFAFLGTAIGMVGLSFAAIPLYRMFCTATGFGGTLKIGSGPAPGATGQTIRVYFNADVNPGLPWKFGPAQRQITLPLGEDQLAFYRATNQSDRPVTGTALYNVTPEKAAKYFHKTACFCFENQALNPGEGMEFPVAFWVDPRIATDPATADVRSITLSYTFYPSLDDQEATRALTRAGPHVGGGAIVGRPEPKVN